MAWEGEIGHDRRRQKAENIDAWEGGTGVYRCQYKENKKTQEGKRPFQKYRRITRNKMTNRTMKRYNDNVNNTEEESKIKTDGEDGTTARDQNPKEDIEDSERAAET